MTAEVVNYDRAVNVDFGYFDHPKCKSCNKEYVNLVYGVDYCTRCYVLRIFCKVFDC